MNYRIYLCILTLSMFGISTGYAQSAKRFITDAKAAIEANNMDEAIDYFSKAIATDPKYYDTYIERAKCYEKQYKLGLAIEDYKIAMSLKPEDVLPIQFAAAALLKQEKYTDAYGMFKKVTDLKKKNFTAYQNAAFCLMHTHDFNKAIVECDKAIEIEKSSPLSYLYKAMCSDSIKDYKTAFDNYSLAITFLEKDDPYKKSSNIAEFTNYFIGMGNAQYNQKFYDLAIGSYAKAIIMNRESALAYELRGKCFAIKMKMTDAEADYNQSILLNSKNPSAFCGRGYVYFRLGEFEKGISDYDKALALNKKYAPALYGKAQCLEGKDNIEEAQKLFQQAFDIAKQNKFDDISNYQTSLKNIDEKIFQTHREGNSPAISFKNGDNERLQIVIPKNSLKVTIEGKVTDESKIEKILIGDFEAEFKKEDMNPIFIVPLNVLMKEEIAVFVQDVYGNELKTFYKLVRAEKDAPKLVLVSPIAIQDKVVELADSVDFKLKVVGKIEDESLIKSLIINGKTASYNSKIYNPDFSIELDIVGIDSIKILAVDEFDNTSTLTYTLKRGGVNNSASNPMGRTWVVFIDNAKYSQLPMLEASSNDVLSMKSALESYNVENVLVKNDMSKMQMEKFFSTELRDLVNSNKVSSIMIFYAGHGKFINENGYWLPVDANKKDEFTFFNVSNLKNYLVNYKPLVHSLVVSDACETGPAFYLAMRDANKIPECGQWEAAKKKSAQVLTSTSIDLNDDKSLFTKSFVNALKSCNDKCISIEKIADKIGRQSVQYQKPKPKLGVIPTLNNDDEATFFFVKK